jgi:HAE1 family hydrophobic/amphiphilic exporter-1
MTDERDEDGASGGRDQGRGLLRVAVQRPVTVSVTALLVVLFGALAVVDLPIQLTPDISVPTLSVQTRWVGASPTEIESEILEPQEDALKSLPGLDRLSSEARPDQAALTLEFAVGTNIDEALVRVTNRLSQVSGYPETADEPSVETAGDSGPPLAVIAIRSPDGAPVDAYRTWVETDVIPEIQRVPGIGDVRHLGGRDSVFLVEFDPTAMAARGVSIPELSARLRSELRDYSGGTLTMGRRRFLVRTMAVDATAQDLARVVLTTGPDGTPVELGDVATVTVGLRDATGIAMTDDRPSMVLLLSRESGTNVLEVTRNIRATVEELDERLFRPEGLQIEVISDQVDYIEGALDLVRQNLLIGAAFAILVLAIFLRSFGATTIIALAIPICVFGTALGMTALGRSVNVVSLAGITFAIGMVLDNSIVSLESIDTWRRKVADTKRAALLGIREVWGALIASTATTIAVFAPVITWEGEVGELLRDVAVAISFAVATSLIVSVWVIPGLAGVVLRSKKHDTGTSTKRGLAGRFRTRIGAVVGWLTRSVMRSSVTVVGAVVACLAIVWLMLPPLEYLPGGNRNLVFGILVPPPGTSVEELERVAQAVQSQVATRTGESAGDQQLVERSFFVGSPDRIFSGAVASDPEEVGPMLAWLQGIQSGMPGFTAFTTQASLFGRRGGGRSIEVNLGGSDLGTLTQVGGRMFGRIQQELPGSQVRPIPSLDPGSPELRAYPRRGESAPLGVSTADLGVTLDAIVDGAIVGELGPDGEPQIDLMIRAARTGQSLEDPAGIAGIPVVAPGGEVVPFGVLADLREELGPTLIQRIERQRAITLQVSPPEDLPLETALARLENDVIGAMRTEGSLPPSVEVSYSGTAGDLDLAKGKFAGVLLLALIISYLLMSALFEDFLAPIVVLVTLPLAAAGGVMALRLVDGVLGSQPLDLMTALGFLILIGVVVNNAILVVDGALSRLREGDDLDAAIRGAVEGRVRPILMTTATSVVGLAPMVLFPGAGSELYRGVGAIVLGGLTLSTLLTLFVVPAFFGITWRARAWVARSVRQLFSDRTVPADAED